MAAAMKSMKSMKAMKARAMKSAAMKVMKSKTMKSKKVSKIARGRMSKAMVLRGSKERTAGGLTKADLMKSKSSGKIVSKRRSAASKKALGAWHKACAQARKELHIKGFAIIGGKTAQGKALYAKAQSIYNA